MTKHKVFAALFSLLLLGALLWPVRQNWQEKPKDNFPFSYYPMFSQKRNSTYEVSYLVGYDAAQQRHIIPYTFAGSGGLNQVRRQINKEVRKGRGEKLAARVARRVNKSKVAPYAQLECLEVVTGEYHLENYFINGDKAPILEKVAGSKNIVEP